MNLKNTPERYGAVAKTLHWTVALCVIGLLCLGLYMTGMDMSPDKFKLYAFHKSVGMVVLTLMILRITWKLLTPQPDHMPTHKPWERALSTLVHVFLYTALLAMPLSGWAMSSAKDYPVSVFGLFTLPHIVSPNDDLADLMVDIHDTLAWIIIGAVALHFAGAMKHHVIDRDSTLRRMLPFGKI